MDLYSVGVGSDVVAANAGLVFGYAWLGAGPTTTQINLTIVTPPTYTYTTGTQGPAASPGAAGKPPVPGSLLLLLPLLLLAVAAAL